ncbi:MAG: hypothetical protein OEZ24_00680 [Candidatus Bathyarchaeota archaeon]|nr:hypothetical protein [Candidatus Bathyarchaeota archaeon]
MKIPKAGSSVGMIRQYRSTENVPEIRYFDEAERVQSPPWIDRTALV